MIETEKERYECLINYVICSHADRDEDDRLADLDNDEEVYSKKGYSAVFYGDAFK